MGFGNAIVGGAAALIRAAIKSPNYSAGSAGWQISKDGSAEFNNVTVRGNVVTFVTAGGGQVYEVVDGLFTSSFPGIAIQNTTSPPSSPSAMVANNAPTQAVLLLSSGQSLISSQAAQLFLEDSTASSITNGLILLSGGSVVFGNSQAAQWQDNTQQLNLPAASGPFIAGESFHSVTLNASLSGRLRVKKLPWNAIWVDCAVATPAAGTSFSCGALPDATYYPTTALVLPLGSTGSVNSRLVIPTSGNLNVVVGAAGTATLGGEYMYPTN